MRVIAMPEEGGNLAGHFGHARHFAFITVDQGNIVNKEVLATPAMSNRHQEFPQWFQSKGVDTVVVAAIGGGVFRTLTAAGVEILQSSSGSIDEVLNAYLAGSLKKVTEADLMSCGCKGHH